MRRSLLSLLLILVLATTAACGSSGRAMTQPAPGATAAPRKTSSTLSSATVTTPGSGFALNTTAWPAGGRIPNEFTCAGAVPISPPMQWTTAPEGVTSLALVMSDLDDTDAAQWIVVDIPAAAGRAGRGTPPPGGRELPNSFGGTGYSPPCPTPGSTHTYQLSLLGFPTAPAVDPTADPRTTLRMLQTSATVSSQLTGKFGQ